MIDEFALFQLLFSSQETGSREMGDHFVRVAGEMGDGEWSLITDN